MIDEVVVVVPVHDEAQRLGACLASLRQAAHHPRLRGVDVHLVVVLDTCSDGSEAVAADLLVDGDLLLAVAGRNVGAARDAGFRAALDRSDPRDPRTVWLASTDADTVVPADWLARHLVLADAGWEAVAGVIRVVDWSHHPDHVRERYNALLESRRRPGGRHTHVYGANLGVLAAAYCAVGGFPLLARGEDMGLWRRLQQGGHRVLAAQASWVTTSARSDPRALAGLGHLLLAMRDDAPPHEIELALPAPALELLDPR